MSSVLQDLKYALRALRKSPGFTTVAVLTLALGIGANTAIFSVVNAVLLNPLPFPEVDRLVTIGSNPFGGGGRHGVGAVSYPDMQDIAKLTDAVSGIAAYSSDRVNLTSGGEPHEVQVARVSPNFFALLRVPPIVGRGFNASETRDPVAVISHALWISSFNGDRSALGRTITLDGRAFTIVGVAPAGFSFPQGETEAWMPIGWAFADAPEIATQRMYRGFATVARLAPGATVEKLQSDLDVLSNRLNAAQQPDGGGRRVVVEQQGGGPPPVGGAGGTREAGPGRSPLDVAFSATLLRDMVAGKAREALLVLFGAVLLVLLIACVNTANLLVARANTREREFAVRRAIGAGRWVIVRQLLVESVLLALLAAALGVLLASFGLRFLATVIPPEFAIGLNERVLVFTTLLAVVTGLGFGLLPALRASAPALEQTLREGAGGTVGVSKRRARNVLVVSEVALALVLLVGSGLLVRSFIDLNHVNPGFDPQGLLAARIRLTPARYATTTAQQTFFADIAQRLEAHPGVSGITLATTLPLSGSLRMLAMDPRRVNPNDQDQFLPMAATDVGANFFSTMRIPVLQGRPITAGDAQGAPAVAVISTSLARRLWPDATPLGKVMPIGGPNGARDVTVVGLVGEVRTGAISDPTQPAIYLPAAQGGDFQQMWVVVRAAHPLRIAPVIRQIVQSEDPMQPIGEMTTYEQMIAHSEVAIRLMTTLITLFAALALVLAVIGIAGVTAYAVSQRTRELGIRIAMGARAVDVLGLLLRETVVLVAIGVGIGLLAAFGVTRTLRDLLYGVGSTDVPTFLVAAVALSAVALLATYVPARRAGRIDPVDALRQE